ncbi:MAG TPA: alpha/beta hydrolase [Symbiobacteriaceae bacterium]|nr:alpha/beta hydrolase [Symbiobacteriaceae bacterium]
MTASALESHPVVAASKRFAWVVPTLSVMALALLTLMALLLALGGYLTLYRFRAGGPFGFLMMFKVVLPAFVWGIVWVGAICGGAGLSLFAYFRHRRGWGWRIARWFSGMISLTCAAAVLLASVYIGQVVAPHDGFAQAFGANWRDAINPEQERRMLQRRWTPFGFSDPQAQVERDIPFWTIPGSDRRLLADLWLPPAGIKTSGLAFIYFHGSAWSFADKGWGTDPMFHHLAAQGHTVLDVAYRLAPETDLFGMVHDVKRAVAWMKANGARYGVNPESIVLGGGSAGAHIALLAAYSEGAPELTPPELAEQETKVAGVVSYYGPTDMRLFASHEIGKLITTGNRVSDTKELADPKTHAPSGQFTLEQLLKNVMNGLPDEVPRRYDLASAPFHVTPGAPPTLLVQGEDDFAVDPEGVRALAAALRKANVPVVYLEFPRTDHGFDIATSAAETFGGPKINGDQYSPPTQAALYDLERFLAVVNSRTSYR